MDSLQKTVKKLPHSPGVYQFKDIDGTVIYVGKARNLSKRVRHYFSNSQLLPEKTRLLVTQIHEILSIQVATEFEALLLEAKLIRQYAPKYNSIAKDDKSPIYIQIQKKDKMPGIFVTRKPKNKESARFIYFGPFGSRKIAVRLLKEIRHSIPFCQQKIRNGKPCFYTHLGLCHPCPSVIEKMAEGKEKSALIRDYRNHIISLIWTLSGHTKKTIEFMYKSMQILANQHDFEQAAMMRDQIRAFVAMINSRYDPFVFEETDNLEKAPGEQVISLKKLLHPYFSKIGSLSRTECYDISTIQGNSSVGSMIVFLNGIPHTDQYRKFKIKDTNRKYDAVMMEEVVRRRFTHREWPNPDLIVVDGGKSQVAGITNLLQTLEIPIPVIGLAKRFEKIIIRVNGSFRILTIPLSSPALQLIQHMRDEAHRFALSYHKKLRGRIFAQHISNLV